MAAAMAGGGAALRRQLYENGPAQLWQYIVLYVAVVAILGVGGYYWYSNRKARLREEELARIREANGEAPAPLKIYTGGAGFDEQEDDAAEDDKAPDADADADAVAGAETKAVARDDREPEDGSDGDADDHKDDEDADAAKDSDDEAGDEDAKKPAADKAD